MKTPHTEPPQPTLRLSSPFATFAGYHKPTNENATSPHRRDEDRKDTMALELRSLRRSKTRLQTQRDTLKTRVSELRHACEHDSMTHVLNRRGLEQAFDRLQKGRPSKKGHVLVFLDGDGFGQINKIYGDDIGDRVICAIAESLRKHTRKTDLLARKGGDEFVIILRHVEAEAVDRLIHGPKGLHARINRNTRVTLSDVTLMITCSIGVAHFSGEETLADILRAADAHMRTQKQARKTAAQKPECPSEKSGDMTITAIS